MKIRPVEAELFHTDWRTDSRDEANGSLSKILRKGLKTEKMRATTYLSLRSVEPNCTS